jgi:2-amino-4-hydroxy-6-hydroxymethyldihydropteridine diphosphokinase
MIKMQYYEVYLLFGSNLGERAANIANAVTHLEGQGVKPLHLSSLYQTEPWGNTDQPKFINLAGKFHTEASAEALMKTILKAEHDMGRKRTKKWEPRIIDIDILFYGDKIILQTDLKIPHPELEKRKFALIPLAEIAPDFIHPLKKKTIRDLLAECTDTMTVDFFHG